MIDVLFFIAGLAWGGLRNRSPRLQTKVGVNANTPHARTEKLDWAHKRKIYAKLPATEAKLLWPAWRLGPPVHAYALAPKTLEH